ncbi:hypothetical protein [Lelliottia sp. WAP21]|uniref:hypothetical protein n=1 Tax=Lelliottia sp. WAP21 TaxID=2877426 RepID=UPI001E283631|nr:hypothetical protein [Lelliottia sp. WAP21]
MLKQITIKNVPGTSNKKIIKSHEIVAYHTYNQIYEHARRHARKIVREAQSVADELRNQAWTEGYVSGMAFAIQDLAKFVNNAESIKNSLITSALETVTVKLKAFFDHEETICQLLGTLADHLSKELQESSRVIITVPEKLHPHSHKIKHIFDNAGLSAEMKKSPHSTLLVEYAKEIWSYELNEVADDLARAAIDKALASTPLLNMCEIASVETLKSIRDTLNVYLDDYA